MQFLIVQFYQDRLLVLLRINWLLAKNCLMNWNQEKYHPLAKLKCILMVISLEWKPKLLHLLGNLNLKWAIFAHFEFLFHKIDNPKVLLSNLAVEFMGNLAQFFCHKVLILNILSYLKLVFHWYLCNPQEFDSWHRSLLLEYPQYLALTYSNNQPSFQAILK